LMNLMGNAIKFTEFGDVNLSVTVSKQEQNLYYLCFKIKDNGIGISEEDQAKLFRPFSQVDASTTRKYGGTGLGLVICQKLIEQMHGEIGVKSSQGQGSTFYFTIPLQHVEFHQKKQKRRASDIDPEMSKRLPLSILIVEDNNVNQIIAKNLFENFGYQPDVVENGKVALSALTKKSYDVIFMDMQMPVMDGVEATKRIVELYGSNKPRIIAMTANVFTADKEKCFAAGMDDFVGKPIVVEHVVDALLRCEKKKSNEPPITEKNSFINPLHSEDQQTVWDQDGFYRRMSNNEKLASKMVSLFNQDIVEMSEQLAQAITTNDYEGTVTLAHNIKDLSDNVGALTLNVCLKQIISSAKAKEQKSLVAQLQDFQQQRGDLIAVLGENFPEISQEPNLAITRSTVNK